MQRYRYDGTINPRVGGWLEGKDQLSAGAEAQLVHGAGLDEGLHVTPVIQVTPLSCCSLVLRSDRFVQWTKEIPEQ